MPARVKLSLASHRPARQEHPNNRTPPLAKMASGSGHEPTFVTWLKSNPPTLGPRTPLQASVRCITLAAAKLMIV
jgi:hypothetical protein